MYIFTAIGHKSDKILFYFDIVLISKYFEYQMKIQYGLNKKSNNSAEIINFKQGESKRLTFKLKGNELFPNVYAMFHHGYIRVDIFFPIKSQDSNNKKNSSRTSQKAECKKSQIQSHVH